MAAGRLGCRRSATTRAACFNGVDPVPGSPKPDPILVADEVSRRFGGLLAVAVEHLEIQRGAITALIGPNGAGKTTFFNLLTGFDEPDTGSMVASTARPISGVPPHRLAKREWSGRSSSPRRSSEMSVIDNMMLGATGPDRASGSEGFLRGVGTPGGGGRGAGRSRYSTGST